MASGGTPPEPETKGLGPRPALTGRRSAIWAIAGLLLLVIAGTLYLTRSDAEPVLEAVDPANPYPYSYTEGPGRPTFRGRFVEQVGVAVANAVLSSRAGVQRAPEGKSFLHLWVAMHNEGTKDLEVTGKTFVVEQGGTEYPLTLADSPVKGGVLDLTLSPGETNVRVFAFLVPEGFAIEDAALRFALGGGAQVLPVKPISP